MGNLVASLYDLQRDRGALKTPEKAMSGGSTGLSDETLPQHKIETDPGEVKAVRARRYTGIVYTLFMLVLFILNIALAVALKESVSEAGKLSAKVNMIEDSLNKNISQLNKGASQMEAIYNDTRDLKESVKSMTQSFTYAATGIEEASRIGIQSKVQMDNLNRAVNALSGKVNALEEMLNKVEKPVYHKEV